MASLGFIAKFNKSNIICQGLFFNRYRWGRKRGEFKGYWSTPEDFQSILISNLMIGDHYPDALINALGSILPHDDEEYVFTSRSANEDGSASINISLSGILLFFSLLRWIPLVLLAIGTETTMGMGK